VQDVEKSYKSFEKRVKAHAADSTLFLLGKGMDISGDINFNVGTRAKEEKDKAHYALKFFPEGQVFIAWDLLRRKQHNGTLNLFFNVAWENIKPNRDCIYVHYFHFLGRSERICDKAIVLGMDKLEDFLDNAAYWMALNSEDEDCPLIVPEEDEFRWPNAQIRKEYSVKQKQRKAEFRRKVLEKYHNQCALCKIGVLEVLQAAHLHSYEVAKSDLSTDDPRCGICLCANHHLMYDRNQIDIDVSKKRIVVLDECIRKQPWYAEFQNSDFEII